MDKILSTRLDEKVILQIDRLSKQLRVSKKKVIEDAVKLYVDKVEKHKKTDILQETHGIWSRDELAETTVRKSRNMFNNSMKRHFV
ncbi:MAG: ribbon-helix-helix protein, CopG family [bacterium]